MTSFTKNSSADRPTGPAERDWAGLRDYMVERQLRSRGILDERVLAAFRKIPREQFVPARYREFSYDDEPIPIGHGQTISQPYMSALTAQSLELRGGEKVLDIGTGCGFHAAVLGLLAARVISIEIIPELADMARKNLARTELDGNITVVCGDGSLGYPSEAPFDGISVAAGAPEIPQALLDQLTPSGVLVIPVGGREEQELQVITRPKGRMHVRVATYCRYVPLRGKQGWR